MIRGIHHVSMKCGDPELYARARAFYRDALGLSVHREWPEGVLFDTGDGLIELFCNGPGEARKGAVRHFALATDDLAADCERLAKAGFAPFLGPKALRLPSDPPVVAQIAFFTGPLGEEIELFEVR